MSELSQAKDSQEPRASLFEATPRERGTLAGLADRWGANPYPKPRTVPVAEYDAYNQGFKVGQFLLRLAEEADAGA